MGKGWLVFGAACLLAVNMTACMNGTVSERGTHASPAPQNSDEGNRLASNRPQDSLIVDQLEEDLDGDGHPETVKLLFNGDLVLSIGENSTTVFSDFPAPSPDGTWPVSEVQPGLEVVGSEGARRVAVSAVWATSKIGTTAALTLYEYRNSAIEQVWNLEEQVPFLKTRLLSHDQNLVQVSIPETNLLHTTFVLPDADRQRLLHQGSLEQMANQDGFLVASTHISFEWEDVNLDGWDELVTEQVVYYQSAPFSAGKLVMVYRMEDEIQPVMAFFTPGADVFETKDLPEVYRLAERFEQARLAGDKGTLIHLLTDHLTVMEQEGDLYVTYLFDGEQITLPLYRQNTPHRFQDRTVQAIHYDPIKKTVSIQMQNRYLNPDDETVSSFVYLTCKPLDGTWKIIDVSFDI